VTHNQGKVLAVPAGDDILEVTARLLIEQAETLPDLTGSVVLLPDLQFAPRLRLQLLQQAEDHGHAALLGPVISTLDHWLADTCPLPAQIPGRARRELILVDVLQQHPVVFAGSNPWQIAASLAALFEELTVHRVPVPADLEHFIEQLRTAYGIDERLPEPLGMEAGVVHRLWIAWHMQLGAMHLIDPGMAHIEQLALSRDAASQHTVFIAGFDSFSAAEVDWVTALLDAGQAHCLLYPQPASADTPISRLLPPAATPATPAATCLEAIFQARTPPMPERAARLADSFNDSPLAGPLAVFTAHSPEQEARAIDLQVRQWLLDERRPVGIVTEDRRLARRVRALLERAGIELQDRGGWALSTTSAAAALERWLETIEEDFAHQPLLDVLKSPFCFPEDEPEPLRRTVYRLEQDIIQHENIARGLDRYRRHIELRRQRLPGAWSRNTATDLQQLLNRLDQAADPLREVLHEDRAAPADLLQRLRDSLTGLGMWAAFEADPAGQRILHEWQLLYDAAVPSAVRLCWTEFRAWFGAALERHDFHPATTNSPVWLLTLEQARLGRFAGLVIGACDREHLPAGVAATPFFNDPVRRELGLPVWPQHTALQLSRFRRLLESAPDILLTWHREADGEPRMPSPWLEALQTFNQLGWGHDLEHPDLGQLVEHPQTRVRGSNPLPVPKPAGYPAPAVPGELLPATLSVSAHGNLIDCPYRFFSHHALGLKPTEVVSEALQKTDYGEKVHRCLEIFHGGVEAWPAPIDEPLTAMNRTAAIVALVHISGHVFTRDLEDNFEHRAWLRRWTALIPAYIDWQIQRQPHWNVCATELHMERQLDGQHTLCGRLDRVDSGPSGAAIIDYKTGKPPGQTEVDSGEKVQLPSYALLAGQFPTRVEYLQLDNTVGSGATLEGETLAELARAVQQRLVAVMQAIETGAPLPAWGDADACRYCDMDVVCRRAAWLDTDA